MKFDKTGQLVRKFCPELANFPDKVSVVVNLRYPFSLKFTWLSVEYIFSPHLAPLDVQKSSGCIIGRDYPKPMLDEVLEKERCMVRIKAAYSLGFHGHDSAVIDGTADSRLVENCREELSKLDAKQKRKTGPEVSDDTQAGGAKKARKGTAKLDDYFPKKSSIQSTNS